MKLAEVFGAVSNGRFYRGSSSVWICPICCAQMVHIWSEQECDRIALEHCMMHRVADYVVRAPETPSAGPASLVSSGPRER